MKIALLILCIVAVAAGLIFSGVAWCACRIGTLGGRVIKNKARRGKHE